MKPDLDTVWVGDRICRSVTRFHAKSFYFASVCLPRTTRVHAYRVYGFCRWVDNLVDEASDPADASRRLGHARELLERAYAGGVDDPAVIAFSKTVSERHIPINHFLALLDGMEMDLTKSRYESFAELELYCHRVAGVVGYMMTHLFGFTHERCLNQARALGIGMQLTNILRDIREDHARGRIYLPLDELRSYGLSEAAIADHRVDDAFREFMRFQIARARGYYLEAERGVPDLVGGSSRLCTRVMGRLYSGILGEIEQLGYDVYSQRASVPFSKKLRTLASCELESLLETWSAQWTASPLRIRAKPEQP